MTNERGVKSREYWRRTPLVKSWQSAGNWVSSFSAFFLLTNLRQIMKDRSRRDCSLEAELQRAHALFAQARHEAIQTFIRARAISAATRKRSMSSAGIAPYGLWRSIGDREEGLASLKRALSPRAAGQWAECLFMASRQLSLFETKNGSLFEQP
jgi:hypothetical protein